MVSRALAEKNKRVLSSGDVARYCGVHFRTVIRWIEKGRLKGYKLPGRGNNRIDEEDFITFLKDNKMPIPDGLLNENKRVLIVDDERPMAAAIQRVLRNAGYETEIAYDGFQAGSLLTSFKPSLMTLDLSMPNMNGFEVLEYMKYKEQFKNVKVLVISALDDKELNRAKDAGAHACVSKPFQKKYLLEEVEKVLEAELEVG